MPLHEPAATVRTGPPPAVEPPPPVDDQAVPVKLLLTSPGVPFFPAVIPQLAGRELSAAKSFNSNDGPSPSALAAAAVGGVPDDFAPQSPSSS